MTWNSLVNNWLTVIFPFYFLVGKLNIVKYGSKYQILFGKSPIYCHNHSGVHSKGKLHSIVNFKIC